MDANRVRALYRRVPTISNKLDLNKLETTSGSYFRNYVIFLTLVPIAMVFDLNGGVSRLGFVRTTFQQDFKVRPDYVTGTLFVAHRQSVPEFKQL